MAVKSTYSGDEIMLFKEDNTSFAWATNHSITFNLSTNEILTKDNPVYPVVYLSKVSNEITTENLFCEDVVTLFNYLITGQPLTLRFGKRKDTNGQYPADGDIEHYELDNLTTYYQSKYILANLEINANTGEKTTYSAIFQSIGKIEQIRPPQIFSTLDSPRFYMYENKFIWEKAQLQWYEQLEYNGSEKSVQTSNRAAILMMNGDYTITISAMPGHSTGVTFGNRTVALSFGHYFDLAASATVTYKDTTYNFTIPANGYSETIIIDLGDNADNEPLYISPSDNYVRARIEEIQQEYTENN